MPASRTWPARAGRARVLIEDQDGASQWAVEHLLAAAGFDVVSCDGPGRLPKGGCPLMTDESCDLVEGADVILNSLPLTQEPHRVLLGALRASTPATPVIVEVTGLRARQYEAEVAGCRLLNGPAAPQRILSEVESAVREREERRLPRPSATSEFAGNEGHLVGICDYISLAFDTVTEILGQPDAADLLTTALDAALEPDRPRLTLERTPLETFGRRVARTRVTWHAPGEIDSSSVDATITVLAVTTGNEAVTELLVNVRVEDALASEAAAVARRFLEELTARIKDAA